MFSRLRLIPLAAAIVLLFSISFPSITALAEEDGLSDQLGSLIDEADLDDLESYFSSLKLTDSSDLKSLLIRIATGDLGVEYQSFPQYFFAAVFSDISAFLPSFAVIAAILLLYGVLMQLKGSLLSQTTTNTIHMACYGAVLVILLSVALNVVQSASDTISSLKTQMEITFPLLLTMMAASGGTVSVGIYQPAVAFLSSGIIDIISDIIYPCAIVLLVMSVIGNISAEFRFRGFQGVLQSLNKWVLGISLASFSIFLTVQGFTSAQYDGISVKAIKYAIGNSVPIVGGFLSGGFDLAIAGSILLKNSLGNLSILMIVAVTFAPVCSLFAVDLLLKLLSGLAELTETGLTSVLKETAASLHYILAGLLCVAFLYFLTVLLFVCSGGVF